jgi:AcrR family transcriptional regulator
MPDKDTRELERRNQILDAAEKVFAGQGFNQARMDDIVSESGLSKGALYWYYKSKDAIILALLDRVFIAEMEEAEKLIAQPGSAEERIRVLALSAVREIRHFEPIMSLGYEFVALAARRREVRERLKSYYQRYTEILAQVIRQGIESGEFDDVDAVNAAMTIIGMYEGLALMWFIDPQSLDWNEMAHVPMDVFLTGIRKRSA